MAGVKEWSVLFNITGRAFGYVEAETEEEAIAKAKAGDLLEDSDLVEWEFDDPIKATVNE